MSLKNNEQIDKGPLLKYLSNRGRRNAKWKQTRLQRRIRKNIDMPNPQHNKYRGWVL